MAVPFAQRCGESEASLESLWRSACLLSQGACDYEFFDLSQFLAANFLFGRGIDNKQYNLLATCDPVADLNLVQRAAYIRLRTELALVQESFKSCVGDVTMDGQVTGGDLTAMLSFWGGPSVADLDNDGITSGPDLAMLLASWGCSTQ